MYKEVAPLFAVFHHQQRQRPAACSEVDHDLPMLAKAAELRRYVCEDQGLLAVTVHIGKPHLLVLAEGGIQRAAPERLVADVLEPREVDA